MTLEEHLEVALAPADGIGDSDEERDRWRIDGDRTADWCARRLRRARTRITSARRVAAEEARAITQWLDSEVAREERDARFFEAKLREWHEALLIDGERGKTIKLPTATLSIRAGRTHVEVDDEEALTQWLEEHLDRPEDALDYAVKPRLTVLGKRFASKLDAQLPGEYPLVDPDTMEVLPGACIVRSGPTFSVKVLDDAPAHDDPAAAEVEPAAEAHEATA